MKKYLMEFVTMSFDLLFFGMIGLFFHLVLGFSFIGSVFAMIGFMFFMLLTYMIVGIYHELKDEKRKQLRDEKMAAKLAEIRELNEQLDAKYEQLLNKKN